MTPSCLERKGDVSGSRWDAAVLLWSTNPKHFSHTFNLPRTISSAGAPQQLLWWAIPKHFSAANFSKLVKLFRSEILNITLANVNEMMSLKLG